MVKKVTSEKLAEITHNEFKSVREDMDNGFKSVREDMDNGFENVRKNMVMLNEKMDDGFTAMRNEMQQGFRVVLAAVEIVEYTKLRMRIDSLEERMEKIQKK